MEIRHEFRSPKRVPDWHELTASQQALMRDLAECGDCIDFEFATADERKDMEALRDLGWVALSYRAANGMADKVQE